MKLILLFFAALVIFSCSSKQTEIVKKPEVIFKIEKIRFGEDSLIFESPKEIRVRPNAQDVTFIAELGGAKIGMKYVLENSLHSVIFYQKPLDQWINITEEQHRENVPEVSGTTWGVGVKYDKELYFDIRMKHNIYEFIAAN